MIFAQSHRSQLRNRAEALARLVALIAEAEHRPSHRVKTRVNRVSKAKRLDAKGLRGRVKATRSRPISDTYQSNVTQTNGFDVLFPFYIAIEPSRSI